MGLDQYLYSVSEGDFERLIELDRKKKAYLLRVDEVYNSKYGPLTFGMPRNSYGNVVRSELSMGQNYALDVMISGFMADRERIAKSMDLKWACEMVVWPDISLGEEIGYWRNDWDLNNMILDNFWDVEKNGDNIVKVRLNEEGILRILEWEHARATDWDNPTLASFSDALDKVRSGNVVYYTPWH